jgi:hypothetical protein
MTDLSKTIAPKSDQLNSDDLIGGPITITLTRVSANEGTPEQPINVFFEGDGGKPYRPGKSMRRVLVHVWGKDGASYVGRSMTLYRDPDVQFGGLKVGGTRISHMSHIDKAQTMALTATKASRKPFTVKPLVDAPVKVAPVDADRIIESAKAAAKKGKAEFLAFYNSAEGKSGRDIMKSHMAEFKTLSDAADAAKDEDPFGLPPLDDEPRLTPEEEAAIQRKIDEQNAGETQ